MNIKMKTNLSKISLIFLLIIFTTNFSAFGILAGNHGEEAFEEPPDGGATLSGNSSSLTIKELIIYGAGYFFKTVVDLNKLSDRYEMVDVDGYDYYGLYNAANSAVYNLEMMNYYYNQLISKTDNTPYNQDVIKKLVEFDYQAFRKRNDLIKDVFDQVQVYLSTGDVRGAYKKIHTDINILLDRLYDVRFMIYWGYLPDFKIIWELNLSHMRIHLFAQGLTMVFNEIR